MEVVSGPVKTGEIGQPRHIDKQAAAAGGSDPAPTNQIHTATAVDVKDQSEEQITCKRAAEDAASAPSATIKKRRVDFDPAAEKIDKGLHQKGYCNLL